MRVGAPIPGTRECGCHVARGVREETMSISSGPQGPLPDPSILEGVSTPPFVRLPEPATLFATRAERLDLLGQTSDLKPYLSFVGDLARA